MPTSLSPTAIANVALAKIGAQPINSMLDQTNPSAIAVNTNWVLCYLEVSRASRWNCLMTPAVLVQVPQTPISDAVLPGTVPEWAPFTTYTAYEYFTYGSPPYYYQTLQAYTSTANFLNDQMLGNFVQTNLPFPGQTFPCGDGSQYPSGWNFKYALPDDYQLLVALNNTCGWWGWAGSAPDGPDWQIMGQFLYTNSSQAVIQYVKSQPDASQFDALFANALTLKLASAISTTLREDGGRMEALLLQGYQQALREAKAKNAGEQKVRRFSPITSSRFNRSRLGGVNG